MRCCPEKELNRDPHLPLMGNRAKWQSSPKEAWPLPQQEESWPCPPVRQCSRSALRLRNLETFLFRVWKGMEFSQAHKEGSLKAIGLVLGPAFTPFRMRSCLSFRRACPIRVPSWAPSEHEAALVIGAPAWYPKSWGLHTAGVSSLASDRSAPEPTPPSRCLFSFFCSQSLIQVFCYLSHVISHWTGRFPPFKLWRNSLNRVQG